LGRRAERIFRTKQFRRWKLPSENMQSENVAVSLSALNKSLKYVPALRASTGRS
jgi:hypothetical protein